METVGFYVITQLENFKLFGRFPFSQHCSENYLLNFFSSSLFQKGPILHLITFQTDLNRCNDLLIKDCHMHRLWEQFYTPCTV